jgi:glycosyltransferase involved in cell wall biosynthesis
MDIQITVIIPHYNETEALSSCLRAILSQTVDQFKYEVLVIDNGTEGVDPGEWENRYPGMRWITNDESPNPYVSRNLGIQESRGIYIGMLDAKCRPQNDWIEKGIAALKESDVVAGRFEIRYSRDTLSTNVFPLLYLNNDKNVRKNYGVPTGNLLTRRKLFDECGVFNTAFYSGSDIEWSLQLLRKGKVIGYCDEMIVDYPPKSIHALRTDMKKYAKGVAFLKRHQILLLWADILRSFFPMRPTTFKDNLTYRRWTKISFRTKFLLWMHVWCCKIGYGLSMIGSYFLSWLKHKPN